MTRANLTERLLDNKGDRAGAGRRSMRRSSDLDSGTQPPSEAAPREAASV